MKTTIFGTLLLAFCGSASAVEVFCSSEHYVTQVIKDGESGNQQSLEQAAKRELAKKEGGTLAKDSFMCFDNGRANESLQENWDYRMKYYPRTPVQVNLAGNLGLSAFCRITDAKNTYQPATWYYTDLFPLKEPTNIYALQKSYTAYAKGKYPDIGDNGADCRLFGLEEEAKDKLADSRRTFSVRDTVVDVNWNPAMAAAAGNAKTKGADKKPVEKVNNPGLQVVASKSSKPNVSPSPSGEDAEAYAKRKNSEYAKAEKERKAANDKVMRELGKPTPKCDPCGSTRQ